MNLVHRVPDSPPEEDDTHPHYERIPAGPMAQKDYYPGRCLDYYFFHLASGAYSDAESGFSMEL